MSNKIGDQKSSTFCVYAWKPTEGHRLYDTKTGEWGEYSESGGRVVMPDGSSFDYDEDRFIHTQEKIRRDAAAKRAAKEEESRVSFRPSHEQMVFLARMNGITLQEAKEALND